jgi:hypothetical protein
MAMPEAAKSRTFKVRDPLDPDTAARGVSITFLFFHNHLSRKRQGWKRPSKGELVERFRAPGR